MYTDEDYVKLKIAKRNMYKVIKYIWAVINKRCSIDISKLSEMIKNINPCPLPFTAKFDAEAIAAAHKNENLISNKMKQVINKIKKERINKKIMEII